MSLSFFHLLTPIRSVLSLTSDSRCRFQECFAAIETNARKLEAYLGPDTVIESRKAAQRAAKAAHAAKQVGKVVKDAFADAVAAVDHGPSSDVSKSEECARKTSTQEIFTEEKGGEIKASPTLCGEDLLYLCAYTMQGIILLYLAGPNPEANAKRQTYLRIFKRMNVDTEFRSRFASFHTVCSALLTFNRIFYLLLYPTVLRPAFTFYSTLIEQTG